MNHWDKNSDFKRINKAIKNNQIGRTDIPNYLYSNKDGCHDCVKFRLNYLPQTLKYLEQVKARFHMFPIKNLDEVKKYSHS